MVMPSKPLREKFDANYIPEPNSGCWLWTASCFPNGYGQISEPYAKVPRGAHRVSYELHVGSIPNGMHVCHKCDIRSCVNPDHLFLGTHSDNMKDRAQKQRLNQNGERNPHSRLTAKQIRAIRSDKRFLREISADYGICFSHISKIKNRKLWAHLK